eukprot:Awhi_evm1s9281
MYKVLNPLDEKKVTKELVSNLIGALDGPINGWMVEHHVFAPRIRCDLTAWRHRVHILGEWKHKL